MKYPIRVRASALIIENQSILLVEFHDETGLHYNLPGGGVDSGESIIEAVQREAKEETCVDIEVDDVVFALEYEPKRNQFWAGDTHSLSLIFACRIVGDTPAQLPARPDANQTAVKWIPLAQLATVELLPHISEKIIAYAATQQRDYIFWDEPLVPERVARYLPVDQQKKGYAT